MRKHVVFILGVIAAGGCGGSGGSLASGGVGPPASSASAFAQQFCDVVAPCCMKAGLRTDGVQCRALIGAYGAHYDATAGEACLRDLRAAATRADFCMGGLSTPTCTSVLAASGGTAKPGDTCNKTDDCAPSSAGAVRCQSLYVGQPQMKIAKCQVQVVGKEGDGPCAGTQDGNLTSFASSGNAKDVPAMAYLCRTSDGLFCDPDQMKCTKMQAEGGPCSSSSFSSQYACVKTATCDTTRKTCVARKAVGTPCTGTTFSSDCVAGAYCDTTAKVCKATAAAGTACMADRECTSGNCLNSKCAAGTDSDLGLAFVCGT
jgi:hypothetical protein